MTSFFDFHLFIIPNTFGKWFEAEYFCRHKKKNSEKLVDTKKMAI